MRTQAEPAKCMFCVETRLQPCCFFAFASQTPGPRTKQRNLLRQNGSYVYSFCPRAYIHTAPLSAFFDCAFTQAHRTLFCVISAPLIGLPNSAVSLRARGLICKAAALAKSRGPVGLILFAYITFFSANMTALKAGGTKTP